MSAKYDFYKIFTILAAISLAILLFYGFSITSSSNLSATKIYKSASYSLQYPSGWQVKKIDNYPAPYGPVLVVRSLNEAVVFTAGSSDYKSFGIHVVEVTSDLPTDPEALKTYFTSEILDMVELKGGSCSISPPDYRSCNFVYDFDYNGAKITQGRIFLFKGNRLYDIVYGSKAEKFEENRPVFDSILNSLRFV